MLVVGTDVVQCIDYFRMLRKSALFVLGKNKLSIRLNVKNSALTSDQFNVEP